MTITGFPTYGSMPTAAAQPSGQQRFAWIGAIIGAVQQGADVLTATTEQIAQQQAQAEAAAQAERDAREAAAQRTKTITTVLIVGGLIIVAIVVGTLMLKRRTKG